MVKFYDARDDSDLTRVEGILHRGGIEYFVAAPPGSTGYTVQIEVAEEDVPKAQELILEKAGKG